MQSAGQLALMMKAFLDGVFHRGPDLFQERPDFFPFIEFHVLRQIQSAEAQELFHFGIGVLRIDFRRFTPRLTFHANIPAPDGQHPQAVRNLTVMNGFKVHGIRMRQVSG